MADNALILGFLSCILVVLAYCYWHYVIKYADFPSYSLLRGLLYDFLRGRIPKNIPFTSYIFQKLVSICQKFRKEGLCLIWFIEPYLVVYNEEAIKIFTNDQASIDHPKLYDIFSIAFGKGLLTSNGERWKRHRKLLNPVFHVGMVRSKMLIFNEKAAMLLQKLKSTDGKPTTDLHFLLRWCSLNAFIESILGFQMNEDNADSVRRVMELISKLGEFMIDKIHNPWYNWKLIMHLFPHVREHLKYFDELSRFGEEILSDMKERVFAKLNTSNVPEESYSQVFAKRPKSFAEILLEMHQKDPSFTMNDVRDEVYTFLVAGFDTVAHTTMWCLFFLGLHPDIQEQAYHEVSSIGKNDVSYDDLLKMPYMDSIIKESLRLHPTLPLIARHLSKDIQCGKYRVPKDTTVVMFLYMWHKDPKLYPDPEKFDPNRFFQKDPEKNCWTCIPFSQGVRNCIGKNYAMAIMKVFLAHILRNFEIKTLDSREDVDLSWRIILGSARPLNMQFTPREPHVESTG